MKKDLWHDCLICQSKNCCKTEITFPLFATQEEKIRNPKINTRKPCAYLGQGELCDIYEKRPCDCRFYPFDIIKIQGSLYWVTWNIRCELLEKKSLDIEKYLAHLEEEIIPNFLQHLDDYSQFRLKELKRKYRYKILRKVKFQ
ncbi:MAG TPA: hypothetical protein DIC35_05360 [Candidatus Moranbacteria bacterium]|nr:hypothetical protein [Candidatus Moranbacteria bacterium]